MQRNHQIHGFILSCALVVFTSWPAFAQTSWNGGSGDFATPGNWNNGTPDGTTPAYFSGVTGTVTVSSNQSAQVLYIENSSAVTMSLGSGDILDLIGTTTVSSAAIIDQNSLLLLTGSGTVQVDSQGITVGAVSSSGTLSVMGTVTLNIAGTLNIDSQGTVNLEGGTTRVGGTNGISGSGVLNFGGGGVLQASGSNLSTGVTISLSAPNPSVYSAASYGVLDTNGLGVTLSGSITAATAGAGLFIADSSVGKTGTVLFNGTSDRYIASMLVAGSQVTQSTGTTTVAEIAVGTGAGNTATFTLSGGTLLANQADATFTGTVASFRVGDYGGTGVFNQTGGTVVIGQQGGTAGGFNIGNQGGNGTYNLSNGVLDMEAGQFDLGRTTSSVATASSGTLNISSTGTLVINGTSQLIGSDLSPGGGVGNGTINQTGGLISVANTATFYLTGNGAATYNLKGGTLAIGGNSLKAVYTPSGTGGSYAFNMGGGTLQVSGTDLFTAVNVTLTGSTTSFINTNGLNATFTGGINNDGLNNGQLVKTGVGNMTLAGSVNTIASFGVTGGSVSQSSGTFTSYEVAVGTGLGNTGTYTLSGSATMVLAAAPTPPIVGGTASSLRIGDFGGTGTFLQSGGTVLSYGSVNVGNQGGNGIYKLSGGTLDVETSGTNTAFLTMARATGTYVSTGEMDISGTAHLIIGAHSEFVGSAWNFGTTTSNGVVNQTGGTVTVDNSALFNLTGSGTGTYNLNGGTLEIGGNSLQGVKGGFSGTYAFNMGGGTLKVYGSDLNTAVNMTLTGSTTSVVNTNGLNATFTGGIGGTGGLNKIGAGSMILTHANTYSGDTLISTGTLEVKNTSGSATGSGNFTLNSGATLTGTGSINSTTNTINGNVIVGPGGTATTGSLTLTSSGTTTFDNANLTFNLNALTAGQDNQLNLGSTDVLFGSGNTLTLNLIGANTNAIADGTEYVLFIGTDNGQFSDLTYDGEGHITNFTVNLTGTSNVGLSNAFYYQPTYLTLENGEIVVTVQSVPEPGTWSLILAGIAALLGIQYVRRRGGKV